MTISLMESNVSRESPEDTRATALAFLLQLLGIPADADKIRHGMGSARALGESDVLRAARSFPVKARAVASAWERLGRTPFPTLAQLSDGSWLVLGRVGHDKILVQDPRQPRPQMLERAAFEAVWTGRLLLLTRRAKLGDLSRRFGLSWFASAVAK
jgi:ATP-binding cassette, subfamily B, bacterial HlyB/CyaB